MGDVITELSKAFGSSLQNSTGAFSVRRHDRQSVLFFFPLPNRGKKGCQGRMKGKQTFGKGREEVGLGRRKGTYNITQITFFPGEEARANRAQGKCKTSQTQTPPRCIFGFSNSLPRPVRVGRSLFVKMTGERRAVGGREVHCM